MRVDGSDGTPQERVYRVVAAVTRYLARHRRLSGAMIEVDETTGKASRIIRIHEKVEE